MAESLTSFVKVAQAVSPVSNAAGAVTATEINCTGYGRVLYAINNGTSGAATASCAVSIWESATSGGTLSLISSSLMTIGTAGLGELYLIDVPVNTAKLYQKVKATFADSWGNLGAAAILYAGSGLYPKTQENTATVV